MSLLIVSAGLCKTPLQHVVSFLLTNSADLYLYLCLYFHFSSPTEQTEKPILSTKRQICLMPQPMSKHFRSARPSESRSAQTLTSMPMPIFTCLKFVKIMLGARLSPATSVTNWDQRWLHWSSQLTCLLHTWCYPGVLVQHRWLPTSRDQRWLRPRSRMSAPRAPLVLPPPQIHSL